MPRRARYLIPRGLPRRGEVVAACAVLIVLAHVVFAPLTLVLAIVFWLVTKVTRWRLSWLAAPAAVGAAWTLAAGPRVAAAGFADGPARVVRYLGAGGPHLLHVGAAFAGIGGWLPRQLPLALLAGSAEAALAGWVSWLHTDEWDRPSARPGALAALRRAATRRAIQAGGVVTRDGSCLGVAAGSGAPVALSWSEAAGGVGVCGCAEADVLTTSFQLVHAAVRRHKPVLAVDLTADPGVARRLAAVCAAAGTALQVFGDPGAGQGADARTWPACYEPFRHGDPVHLAALIMGKISWEGPGSQYRRSCAAYLEDAFELLDVAPGDPRVPVLDEIIHLLNPSALRARLEHVPASYPRRDVLAERTRVSVSLLLAEPATTAHLARQLRELRASAFGRWLRPPAPGAAGEIDLGRTVTERGAALFCLGGAPEQAASVMLTRLVCQDLLAAGEALAAMDVDGDGIVWLTECGSMPAGAVTDLIARGPHTGLPVLAVTTSAQVAGELADLTNVLVVHRMTDAAVAHRLAMAAGHPDPVMSAAGGAGPGFADGGRPGSTGHPGAPASAAAAVDPSSLGDGEFVLAVKDPPRLVPRAVAVPPRIRRSPRERS
jgi:hypothetical protein